MYIIVDAALLSRGCHELACKPACTHTHTHTHTHTCVQTHTRTHTRTHTHTHTHIHTRRVHAHVAHQEHKQDKGGAAALADQRTTSRLNLPNGSLGAEGHSRPPFLPAVLEAQYKERERELAVSDPVRMRAMLPHELPKKVQVLAAEAFIKGSTIPAALADRSLAAEAPASRSRDAAAQ
jgi:hypothetical protein